MMIWGGIVGKLGGRRDEDNIGGIRGGEGPEKTRRGGTEGRARF